MSVFKEKLKSKKTLIGTLLTMPVPAVAEIMSQCGYDWLWIDLKHSALSLEQAQMLMQAKENDCAAFVRVPNNDETWLKRVLDLGADGIIVPQVKNAQEALTAIAACKYPPQGNRSVGIGRAHAYGMEFASYVERANNDVSVFLQIEHMEGVKNIDSILKVPSVDGILIGPYDLSGSLNKLGQTRDTEVCKAFEKVQTACIRENIPIGIFSLNLEQAKQYFGKYQLLAVGIDTYYLWTAAKANINALREMN